jgi:hypothetical protein
MKTAEIRREPNWVTSNGPDMLYYVDLYKNKQFFGTIDVSNKSIYYAQDVVENWENGVLKEDNQFIKRSV